MTFVIVAAIVILAVGGIWFIGAGQRERLTPGHGARPETEEGYRRLPSPARGGCLFPSIQEARAQSTP